MKLKTAAVIVTYNRKELLLKNLKSLVSQNHSIDKIIIIDNASTDGTYDYLKDNILEENQSIEFAY